MKGETSAMVSARENIGFGGGGVWVVVEEEVEGGAPAAWNSAMEKRGQVGRGGGAGGGAIPGAENLGVGYHDRLRYWRSNCCIDRGLKGCLYRLQSLGSKTRLIEIDYNTNRLYTLRSPRSLNVR